MLADRLKSLSDELAALPLRARYGLVVLLALLGFSILERTGAAALQAETKLTAAVGQAATVAKGEETLWLQRAETVQSVRDQLAGRIWMGETPGIIAAAMQSDINALAAPLNPSRHQMEIDPSPIDLEASETGLKGLRFRIRVNLPSRMDHATYLAALESFPQALFIDELSLNFLKGGATYADIQGIAPIRLGSPDALVGSNVSRNPSGGADPEGEVSTSGQGETP